jgi:hypothetical protein
MLAFAGLLTLLALVRIHGWMWSYEDAFRGRSGARRSSRARRVKVRS